MSVDLGKIIVATGFEWLPKVQNIAESGHTDSHTLFPLFLSCKIYTQNKELLLTAGFEPESSGVGSDLSAICVTPQYVSYLVGHYSCLPPSAEVHLKC